MTLSCSSTEPCFNKLYLPQRLQLWLCMSRLKDALCDLDRFLARWGWLPIHLINIFMVVFFMVFGMGFEIYYAIVQLIDSIDTFHVFAKCTPVAG